MKKSSKKSDIFLFPKDAKSANKKRLKKISKHGGKYAKGSTVGDKFKMGEDVVYIGKGFGTPGYENDICLHYEKDDTVVKCMSKKSFNSFIEKGTLKPLMATGGEVEGVDLFEDYENIPPKVQEILDKYEEGFEDGDYEILESIK